MSNATRDQPRRRSVGAKPKSPDIHKPIARRGSFASLIFGLETVSSDSLTSVESNNSGGADELAKVKNPHASSVTAPTKVETSTVEACKPTPNRPNETIHPIVPITVRKRGKLPRKNDFKPELMSVEEKRLHLLKSSGAIKTKQVSFKEHSCASGAMDSSTESIIHVLSRSSSPTHITPEAAMPVGASILLNEFSHSPASESSISPSLSAQTTAAIPMLTNVLATTTSAPISSATAAPSTNPTESTRPTLPTVVMEPLPNRAMQLRSVRQGWVARINSPRVNSTNE